MRAQAQRSRRSQMYMCNIASLKVKEKRKTETLGGVGRVSSVGSSVVSSGQGQDLDHPRQHDDNDDHDHDQDEIIRHCS